MFFFFFSSRYLELRISQMLKLRADLMRLILAASPLSMHQFGEHVLVELIACFQLNLLF